MAGSPLERLSSVIAGSNPAAVTPAQTADPALDGLRLLQQQRRRQTHNVLDATVDANPDEAAKARAVAREVGIPEETAKRNPQDAQRLLQRQKEVEWLAGAPATANWLSNPANAEIARDSVQQLSALERVGNAFRRGFLQQEQGRAESRFSMERNPELAARLEAEINGLGKNGTGIVSFLEEAATVLGQQASTLVNPATVGMVAGGAAVGSVVPGVGTAAGATAGLVASVFRDTVLSTSANAYKTMLEANVPEDRALAFSGVAGGIVGALDIVGFTRFLKMFGIGEDAAQKAAAKGVTEVVKRVGKEYATVVGIEVGTEIAQEVVQVAAEELAKATSEGAAAPATAAEVLERIEEVAVATAKAMVVLGAPGGAATYKRERKAQQAAEEAAKPADEIQKEMAGSPLFQRDPEAAIEAAAQVAPIEARVDIEKLVELAQTRGVSPDELFAELGVEEQAAIATLAEGEVTLPPEAVARLMASENWNDVKDNLRYGENEFSVGDAKLSREEAAAAAEELTAPALEMKFSVMEVKPAEGEAAPATEAAAAAEELTAPPKEEAAPVEVGRDQEVTALLDDLDASLTGDAARAVDKFVGHEAKARERGPAFGIMYAQDLEAAARGENKPVADQIEAAFAPVREKLRQKFGDKIVLYRVQTPVKQEPGATSGSAPAGERAVLSWTSDKKFAEEYAGVNRDARVYSEEEIAAFEAEFEKNRSVKISSRYELREMPILERDPSLGNMIGIIDRGEFITDAESVRAFLESDNEYAQKANARNEGRRQKIVRAEVPLDDVMFATDRAGQSEFIVRNRRGSGFFIDEKGSLEASVAAPAEPQFDMAAAQEQLRAAGFPEQAILTMSKKDMIALTDPVDPGNPRTARVGTQPVEAEVGLAEEEMGYQALFRTASDAGMSRSVYQSYLAAIARVKEAARQRQERKHLRAEEAKLSDEWNAAREEVLAEVREAVNNEPVYQALGSLGALRLDRNAVIDLYLDFNAEFVTGRESMNLATRRKEIEEGVLPAMNKHSDTPASPPIAIFSAKGKDGINPNLLAERFGFESGRAMVDAMASAKARETEIFARTEAEMARRYPELQENLRGVKAAIESLHETDWVNVIAAELNQLRAATDQKRTKPKLLRAEARKNFGNINANDAKLTGRFENQERKRRREAGRLVRKNDRKGAAKAKLLELFNHEYFKEAIRFRNEQSADKKLIRRIMAKGAKFEGRDADYVDAAKLLLARYDGLAPENRAENAREEAAEAILAAFNDALPPPKSVDRLTVNEWRAIMQATRAIYQQALDGGKLKAQGKNATLERAVAEMVASAEVLPDVPAEGSTPDGTRTEPGVFSRAGFAVMNGLNTFRQVGFIFERLDRGGKAGPWSKYLYRTMESAYAAKQKIDKNLLLPIVDKLAQFTGDANMLKKTKVEGGIGVELTNIDRFMLALNFGNTSNIDKVLDERGMKADPRFKYGNWTYETVRAEIASLPPGLTDLVQETWDAFASIYPEVEQTYRDRYGTSPTRIEPQSLNLGDGRTLRGGYFPMMYDRSRMVQVRQEGMDTTATKDGKFDNEAFFQSVVYSGMTKNRTSFSAPVDLDAGRMALAFGQVSHYVTHYNAVRDARKIINSQGVAQTIVAKEGNQVLELLNKWVDDIAAQGSRDTDTGFLTKAAEYIRRSTTAAFLSLSLRTLFMQPLGVANSIYLLGRKEKGGFSSWQGIKSLVKDGYGTLMAMSPTQRRRALDQMYSLSNLMSDRINSIDVAVGEAVDRARGTGSLKDRIASTGLRAISRVQFATVDVPTWFGAFNKAVGEGKSEGDAAAIADKIVSQAQGDGRQFALSEAQRSRNPLWRVSTPFLTFVFAQHNQLRQIMEDARDNNGAGSKRSMASKMFWAVGVGAVLEAAMAGDTPEEDDDLMLWAARRFAAQSITAAVPVFGDTAATYLKYGQAFGGKNVAVQMIDGVGKAIGETYKVATDEKDFDEATLKALIKGFGVAAGVPGTSQAVRLVDAFAGEEEDFIRTLMMGKPPGK